MTRNVVETTLDRLAAFELDTALARKCRAAHPVSRSHDIRAGQILRLPTVSLSPSLKALAKSGSTPVAFSSHVLEQVEAEVKQAADEVRSKGLSGECFIVVLVRETSLFLTSALFNRKNFSDGFAVHPVPTGPPRSGASHRLQTGSELESLRQRGRSRSDDGQAAGDRALKRPPTPMLCRRTHARDRIKMYRLRWGTKGEMSRYRLSS